MIAEKQHTPTQSSPEDIAGLTDPIKHDMHATDADEYPAFLEQVLNGDQHAESDAQEAVMPGTTEVARQDSKYDGLDLPERVKDAYYQAGAKYTMLMTMGETSNSPVIVNQNALKRRQKVSMGIGVLACAKIGFDIYRSAKGFSSTFQAETLSDLVAIDLPEDTDRPRSKIDSSSVMESVLDYTHQGLESSTNSLLTQSTKRNRKPKAKATLTT